jgi:uncharacterized protein YkwD
MQFLNSFPLSVARKGTCGIVALSFCLISLNLSVSARTGGVTTTPARPVARLISTSDSVAGNRARSRYVPSVPNIRNKPTVVAPSAAPSSMAVATVVASGDEQRAIDLVNEQRRARGLSPLACDGGLMRLARLHASNMAHQDFFDHVGPDGLDAVGRADALGLRGWRALGENIAYNQGYKDAAGFAVERWMLSSRHRENILSAAFTHTGLGVARASDGRIFFTQVFMMR